MRGEKLPPNIPTDRRPAFLPAKNMEAAIDVLP